jgi:hypothetical protein
MEMSMSRKYYTLAVKSVDNIWGPDFGDYNRKVVAQEMADRRESGDYDSDEMQVISSGDSQAEINAAIAELNAQEYAKRAARTKITIDTKDEKFGAEVSIAHLAANTFRNSSFTSKDCDIYQAEALVQADWKPEIENIDMEYATGISVTFKDGSVLHVGAWATEPAEEPDYDDEPRRFGR